ncbi:hypothetical protein D3C78_1273730 [compost metagenome]
MIVDRSVLLDEGVRGRHVGFGLVIVVIGNEILDGVVREERLELAIQLRGERLVGRQHQGRALHLRNDVGNAEGLARAGHTEQGLVRQACLDALYHLADSLGLVAGRLKTGDELELGHVGPRGNAATVNLASSLYPNAPAWGRIQGGGVNAHCGGPGNSTNG